MPRQHKPLEQLRILSELLARSYGADPEGAIHAQHILDYFSEEAADEMQQLSMQGCASKLAQMHLGPEDLREVAFAHWHVPESIGASPLWIRQAIVAEMKQLAGRRRALLLVSGVRESICPAGGYWTSARSTISPRARLDRRAGLRLGQSGLAAAGHRQL